jgi:hypothetical protein
MDKDLETEPLVAISDKKIETDRIATGRSSISAWHDEEREIQSTPSEWTEAKAFPLEICQNENSSALSTLAHAWSSAGVSDLFESHELRGSTTARDFKGRPRKKGAILSEKTEIVSLTSLHAASMHGDEDSVRLLATESACAARDSSGFTPLHFAACYGHGAVVRVLLDARGDANAASLHGWTPLHLAARNGHVDCLHALLHAGPHRPPPRPSPLALPGACHLPYPWPTPPCHWPARASCPCGHGR